MSVVIHSLGLRFFRKQLPPSKNPLLRFFRQHSERVSTKAMGRTRMLSEYYFNSYFVSRFVAYFYESSAKIIQTFSDSNFFVRKFIRTFVVNNKKFRNG